jgi:hypothetical protein
VRHYFLIAATLFVTVSAVGEQAKVGPAADLEKRATVIKPSPDELKWRQIPWVLDLAKGQALAAQEGRPIFVWVTGDDPLEPRDSVRVRSPTNPSLGRFPPTSCPWR